MNNNLIEQIRDSVDLLELIKEYVPSVKKSGRTYKACCPFHHEKTPSFSISPDKGLFYCFGCQTGGDVFAFLMKIENLSFNEAARKLAQRAGIEWHQEENMTEDEKSRLQAYKIMGFAKDFYHKQLLSAAGEAGRTYIKERGLTKETTIKFELGYALFDGFAKKALEQGYNIEDLKKLGVASYNGGDYFRNRLMFPIFNHRGEPVAFGARIMGEGQPKYLNSPETMLFSKSRILYALNFAAPAIRKEGKVILLEGYMDVIGCHQAGVENCVAPLGTSFTPEHAKLLRRYTNQAAVVFDPDSAGIHAALRAALILVESGLYVRIVTLPEGLDPDEFILKHGADAFTNIVNNAQDIINFQTDMLLKGKTSLDPQEKTTIAAELLETIQKQPDEIIKREWVRTAADRLDIAEEVLLRKMSAKGRRYYQSAPQKIEEEPAKDNTPPRETDLIKLLLKFPRYIENCKELKQNNFENNEMWLILKSIEAIRAEHPNVDKGLENLLIQKHPELESTILKLSLDAMPIEIKPSKEIEDYLGAINKAANLKRLKDLQEEFKKYPSGQVPLDLLKEQIEIQKKLKS